MKLDKTTIIGFVVTTALGILTIVNNVIDYKKMEERIDEGVSKALAERERES